MSDDDDLEQDTPQADPNKLAEDIRQRLADDDQRWDTRWGRLNKINLFSTHKRPKDYSRKRFQDAEPSEAKLGDEPIMQSLIRHAAKIRGIETHLKELRDLIPSLDGHGRLEALKTIGRLEDTSLRHQEAINNICTQLEKKQTEFTKLRMSGVIKATEQAAKLSMHRERLTHRKKKSAAEMSMEELMKLATQSQQEPS